MFSVVQEMHFWHPESPGIRITSSKHGDKTFIQRKIGNNGIRNIIWPINPEYYF